jgi:uncharacterized protein
MPAIRFGRPGRQLFGFHHTPIGATPRTTCVVVCNPFMPDAMRAQRMIRMLSERLARNGFHVLRFDYFGTGDSDGDCEEATAEAWVADILTSHGEIMARSRAARAAWIGLGLGGGLAARASLKLDRPLALLGLWEPVLDGEKYLAALAELHTAHFTRDIAGLYPPGVNGAAVPAIVDQLLGFPISADLRDQLVSYSKPLPAPARAERIVLLGQQNAMGGATELQTWLRATAPAELVAVPAWSTTDFDDLIASAHVYTEVIHGVADSLKALP